MPFDAKISKLGMSRGNGTSLALVIRGVKPF